jgi:O-antigen ligase
MMALVPLVMSLYGQRRFSLATTCMALVLGLFANMAFVVSARSALVYVPVLLFVFAFLHFNHRQSTLLLCSIVVGATIVWFTSSYLQARIADIATEYQYYRQNIPRSTVQRLEYWQKVFEVFYRCANFRTGTTERLFQLDAVGKTGLSAEVVRNPHNQTLNVAPALSAVAPDR